MNDAAPSIEDYGRLAQFCAQSVETGALSGASLARTFKFGSACPLLMVIMAFPEYLDPGRSNSAAWPDGDKTWKLLLTIGLGLQSGSTGGSAYEGLLASYRILQRLAHDNDSTSLTIPQAWRGRTAGTEYRARLS
jgi:hypothetical protein